MRGDTRGWPTLALFYRIALSMMRNRTDRAHLGGLDGRPLWLMQRGGVMRALAKVSREAD